MSWRSNICCLSLIFFGCSNGSQESTVASNTSDHRLQSTYLIEAEELVPILRAPAIKVIDFRRKASYEQGHIPGAINFWRSDIENSEYPYGGMKAEAAQLEDLFSSFGIKNGDQLIAYDDVGSCDAARLWWVLESYGFKHLKILNGGLTAWKAVDGSISTEEVEVTTSDFRLDSSPDISRSISMEVLTKELSRTNPPFLLDNRTLEEFTGKRQKKGAIAAGHLPESIHIDWVANVNYEGDRKFKSLAELKAIYESLEIPKDRAIVTYCHTGVRSALTYFVLTELLEYENVRNYDGSWVEWSHMKLPFEQDSVTVIRD